MKVSNLILSVLFVSSFVFIGCSSSGGSSSEPIVGSTTVTAVDGYIKDANITDNAGQVGVYISNGKYTFANSITYPLRSNGGVLEDTNASFDINMSAESGLVLSPITAFLENNSTLLGKLANLGLGSSTLEDFSVDYVDTNNSDLAKLSQLLYLVQKDSALLSAFQTSLAGANPSSLSDIFTLAEADVNATMGAYGVTYRAFLTSVLALTASPSEYETQLESAKAALSEIQHNGTIYKTVTSPSSGRVWLDRNLGASQVCTSSTDTACYGDYYQWGRDFDGHQELNSTATTTPSNIIDNVGSNFITLTDANNDDWTTADSNGLLRNVNWRKSDGSTVCPVGYHVPTIAEIQYEANATSTLINNRETAFSSFLKLPAAGYRDGNNAIYYYQSEYGYLWSASRTGVTIDDTQSDYFGFAPANANPLYFGRAHALTVRCTQDRDNALPTANAGADQNATEGTTVDLNASASSDSDGVIVSYLWEEGGVALSRDPFFSKSDFSPETHTITLTITDDYGDSSVDTVVVTVINILTPTHNGVTYGSVISPYTGKRWLDRNLGASQVCTAFNDTECYGDYYQWGRNADGHEKATSTTISTLATNVSVVGHSSFILSTSSSTNYEWVATDVNGTLRAANWSKTDGSSVCPVGYRVPTVEELSAETIDASTPVTDYVTAFNNFLKLPMGGNRYYYLGSVDNQAWNGYVWTNTPYGSPESTTSIVFDYYTDDPNDSDTAAWMKGYFRAQGNSVRCIMNEI